MNRSRRLEQLAVTIHDRLTNPASIDPADLVVAGCVLLGPDHPHVLALVETFGLDAAKTRVLFNHPSGRREILVSASNVMLRRHLNSPEPLPITRIKIEDIALKRSQCGWIIDRDHEAEKTPVDERAELGTNENAVGIMGPSTYKGDGTELTKRFRMLNDDGEVVYEGRSSTDDDQEAFAPLDDFGEGNAGCTVIQYWVTGKGGGWKPL